MVFKCLLYQKVEHETLLADRIRYEYYFQIPFPPLSVCQGVFWPVLAHAFTLHQFNVRRAAWRLQFNRFECFNYFTLVLIGLPTRHLLLLLPTDRFRIAFKVKLVSIVAEVTRDLSKLLFYGGDHDGATL